jgi:hypothetical protein
MQLRSKITPDGVLVYREKWGTLALAAALGIGCVAFAAGFHFLQRAVVVFLPAGVEESAGWLSRMKAGVSVSGTGRPYMLGSYPRGEGRAIEAALRQVAPTSVRVRFEQGAVFNTKASTDEYAERR